jgi:hypothetical protein
MTRGEVVRGKVEIMSSKNEILLFLNDKTYAAGMPIIRFISITIKESLKLKNIEFQSPASFNSFIKRPIEVWKNIPERRSMSAAKNRNEII